jgi:thiamine-phosphate pyrophosphorylase
MARRLNAGAPPCPVGGLILMTDDGIDTDWVASARELPAGSAVIVRHRNARHRERLVRELIAICRPQRIRVIVADDVKLAVRTGADGVHLPERRMAQAGGVRAVRCRWIITTSAHGRAGLARARRLPIDAVLVSPFMPTRSHPGAPGLGAVGLAALVCDCRMPAFALGGIDANNVVRLTPTGVRGIALIRGWIDVRG